MTCVLPPRWPRRPGSVDAAFPSFFSLHNEEREERRKGIIYQAANAGRGRIMYRSRPGHEPGHWHINLNLKPGSLIALFGAGILRPEIRAGSALAAGAGQGRRTTMTLIRKITVSSQAWVRVRVTVGGAALPRYLRPGPEPVSHSSSRSHNVSPASLRLLSWSQQARRSGGRTGSRRNRDSDC